MSSDSEDDTRNAPTKSWHPQQETILKQFGEQACCYRYIHYISWQAYAKTTRRATLPVIVISTITGTASFAMESVPLDLRPIASQAIGAGNLIAGLIATISTFLKLQENTAAHKAAALAFGKFSRNIRMELALPLKDRTKDGITFIDECRAEFDRLLEEAPDINKAQLQEFERTFPSNSLYTPEIIDLHPIRQYNGIRELSVLKALRRLTGGDSPEKRKLKSELAQIRTAGHGLVTAPRNTTVLKRAIFKKQKERDLDPMPMTPDASDDEEESVQ